MLVEKVSTPTYRLTLTADEMGRLWRLLFKTRGIAGNNIADNPREAIDYADADYFFGKIENARPPGGFK
jgi:hypothetical protein